MPRKKFTDPKVALGVVRVSTGRQDIGAEAQSAHLRVWATTEGITLVKIVEARISGAKKARKEQLRELVVQARKEGAGLLVSTEWDRFARSKHFFTHLEEACEEHGVRPVTVEGGLNETPLLRNIKQVLAEEERRNIMERNRRRARQCISEGRTHGGSIPYGWRRKGEGKVGTRNTIVELEHDPKEQEVLDMIVKMRTDGVTFREVCERLNKRKSHMIRGKMWTPSKMHRIIHRERSDELNRKD